MSAKLCATLMPRDTSHAMQLMADHAPLADLFELRVDAMQQCDLAAILKNRPRPLIVTNRSADEGGRRPQPTHQRLALLQQAIQLNADYVDVELAALPALRNMTATAAATAGTLNRRSATRLIVSYHNLVEMPADIADIARRISRTEADIVKVVGTARTLADNLPIFNLLQQSEKPTIALAMGELGLMSRLLAGKFDAAITFAAIDPENCGAPGQLTLEQMRRLYRATNVNPATKVYAVMGNPVAHSLSPAIHNAAFQALDIDALYLPLKVEADPAEAVRTLAAIPIDGYSVTIPHKQAVMAACAEIDPLAADIGAVNTLLRRDDGSYFATNTDVTSAMKVLANALAPRQFDGLNAAIIGAGGVARAYAFGLRKNGAKVVLTDVDPNRAAQLADAANATAADALDLPSIADALPNRRFDILMNASPIGMWPNVDASPVNAALLRPGTIVFDAVYNPLQTRLLKDAAAAGCTTISGIEQFIGQAVEQFELWTQRPAPAPLMRNVVLDALN